ncbi:kinase-like protein [Schizopora paradoxa]|uniref:Kinase-like protein n=1 Tax=Schizopora paradoxa TaxID=27342 RepID=A0A0H2R864_9AGAM|nr:kinase-like protein [Schizopora paradoxa]
MIIKNFARELRVWAFVSHSNVVTLLGYVREAKTYCILSEWMEDGSLNSKLKRQPMPFTVFQCLGIAQGMCYLHKKNIVHADLKTYNVLLTRSGQPLLADFGISTMADSIYSKGFYTTNTSRGSIRWLPYEYYHIPNSEKFRFTTKSDVWAFGMTILELLTGNVPYAHIKDDGPVAAATMKEDSLPISEFKLVELLASGKPQKDMWQLCQACWIKKPNDRPSMQQVLSVIIWYKYHHGLV